MSAAPSRTRYGKACANCAKVKAKCTILANKDSCERCSRLEKICVAISDGSRRRLNNKQAPKKQSLESRAHGPAETSKHIALRGPTESSNGQQFGSDRQNDLSEASLKGDGHLEISPEISPDEAHTSLTTFRTSRLNSFPFVHLPETHSEDMRQTRPLLWLSIMACCASSNSRQRVLVNTLRAQIAERAVARSERSMDLLLAVLGFLGWGVYYTTPDAFMLMYSHIASALAQDLGLDRAPVRNPSQPQQQPVQMASNSGREGHPLAPAWDKRYGTPLRGTEKAARSMEERRAVLSVYLLTVIVASFHQKPIALPWTDHMNECLSVLDDVQETPLDGVLTYQVRLHRVAMDIPPLHTYTSITSTWEARAMREFQIAALQARLQEVKQTLPVDLGDDAAFLCKTLTISIEAAIYGIALYRHAPPKATDETRWSRERQPNADGHSDANRHEMLTACVRLARQWCDEILSQTPAAFFSTFSFPMVTQITCMLVLMHRLVGGNASDSSESSFGCHWDCHLARQLLDLPGTLETLARISGDAPVSAGFTTDGDSDIFSQMARAARRVCRTWEAIWAEQACSQSKQSQSQPAVQERGTDRVFGDMMAGDPFSPNMSMASWMADSFLFN